MDVPLQDILIGCYDKQTEGQLQVLQINTSSQHHNAMHKKSAKTEYMEVLLKYCGKAITVTVQNLLST